MEKLLSGIIAFLLSFTTAAPAAPAVIGEPELISPALFAPSSEAVPAAYDGKPSVFDAKLAAYMADTADTTKNTVYSPFSLYAVIAMLREGANGDTLAEIDSVLGTSGENLAENTYATLSHLLTLEYTVINITDSVWLDKNFTPKQEYLDKLARFYLAECYRTELRYAEQQVNSYVEKRTNGLIKELLTDDALDSAVMMLLNTLYLDAEWQTAFKKESTHKRPFTNADGTKTEIDFLYSGERRQRVIDNDYCEGITIPYKDGSLSFVALMPKDETMTAAELTETVCRTTSFANLTIEASGEPVKLYLPKFEIEQSHDMSEVLKGMGMTVSFTGAADFTGIAHSIAVDQVIQKAVIKVDEKGTEAAAATAASMKATSAGPSKAPRILEFDRPFCYAVIDTLTGTVLFAGEYNVGK